MNVLKRDNREENYDIGTIRNAISKANKSVSKEHRIEEDLIDKITDKVNRDVLKTNKEIISVEDIQDLVEQELIKANCYEIAKSYILYRDKRTKERNKNSEIHKLMEEKLNASNVVNQNANLDEHSFGGRRGEMDSAYLKQEALDYYMSERFANNHKKNRIYVHDLDSLVLGMHNCLSIPFDVLFKKGVKTRQTFIRGPKSVSTALQQVAVIIQLQSLQQFGGVSATHLDWTLVPYIRMSFFKHFKDGLKYIDGLSDKTIEKHLKNIVPEKVGIEDKQYRKNKRVFKYATDMLIKEIHQGCEALIHNLNSLQSRAGNQLPFSSINYGTCTLPEGRIFIKSILENTIKGTGKGATSIFPCQIFQLKNGVNTKKNEPNYDLFQLALKCTSKRMYPNYANCDWSNNDDSKSFELKRQFVNSLDNEKQKILKNLILKNEDIGKRLGLTNKLEPITNDPNAMFSTMGCRTANGYDVNWFNDWVIAANKFIAGESVDYNFLSTGQQKDGRGNICPATIILPTLAMEAKKKVKEDQDIIECFMSILDKAITDCKDELIERYNWIGAQDSRSASFMYDNGTMFGYIPQEGIKSALKHGTLAVGQIGLSEALKILIGCDHTTKKGMKVAKQIEQLFKDRCAEFKEKYQLNFGVYYTPAESLCLTSFKKFTEKYGLLEGITAYKDNDGNLQPYNYFTNSMHVNVRDKVTPFEKIDIESELVNYSNAGCITYVEIGDNAMNNLKALEQIVLYAKKKDIPYFALNVRLSDCTKCGYSGYIDFDAPCPVCGADHDRWINDYARITGYLSTTIKHFNFGKQCETKDRYVHVNKLTNWKK